MRGRLVVCLLAACVHGANAQQGRAVQVAARALRAVEGDSVSALRADWESALRSSSSERDFAALGLATLDALTYRFEEAERRFAALRASTRDSGVLARAAYGHAFLLQSQGLHRNSEEPLRAAMAVARAIDDSSTLAESYVLLSASRMRTQGLPAALAVLDSADGITPSDDARSRVAALCARASFHALSGRADVVEIANAGIALAKRIGNRRAQAACTFAQAQYFVQRGDLFRADALMREAAELQRASRHRAALAANLQWRGYLRTNVASYGLALDLLHEAIVEAKASQNASALAWAHANLATIYSTLSDRYASGLHAEVAERLMREQGDVRGLALVRGIRANLAIRAADTVAAARLGDEAQRLIEEYGSPELTYTVFRWRLQRYAAARNWADARAMLDSAEATLRQSGGQGWIVGQNFSRAALALLERDLEGAERALNALGDPREHRQPLQQYSMLVMWAELNARRGQIDRAERDLRDASDVIDAWRADANSRVLRHLAFQRADEFGDPDNSVATVLAALAAAGRHESAFELAERRRARQLGDQMARASALRNVEGDTTAPASIPAGVAARQVVEALPDSQIALIEYVTGRGGESTIAFVISKHGLRAVTLPAIDSIAESLSRFVALLEAGGPFAALARELGTQLLEPVVRALPDGIGRLVIVPDDILHRLPFDALHLPDWRHAIERYAISTSPSAAIAVMLLGRPVRSAPPSVLAVGDPEFADQTVGLDDTSIIRSLVRRGQLARLVGSGNEARLVARFAPSSEVRLRETATEAFLKTSALDTFTVIHLATHALVDDRAIGRSVLALSPGGGEDGFMTPGDVAALELRADLVVLSACRTAGGVLLGGEGINGLAAPFLGAGARTVVASTWPVNDRRATELIERFYRAVAGGATLGDALRAAKLEALRAGLPPSEWAAWTLIGDPTATIPLRTPPMRAPWWIAAGLFAAVAAYGARTVNRWKREVRSAPSA